MEMALGESIRSLRLQKNLDRKTLAAQAGISMGALRHLELGQGANLRTLIRIVRALNKQEWLLGIAPRVTVNPLHMMRSLEVRQRARSKRKKDGKKEKEA
ncbi:MAG: XRE family transcriptional regulator [Elusimicrobia bacterium]|nr:MAG: XRE family transcriptional regulator [Elusimicrobiota bacterium]